MKKFAGKPNTLKEVNKAIILGKIRSQDGITQPELAAETDISLQTVNKIVKELEAENMIRCSETVKETGGRKAKLYKANEDNYYIACVYIQQEQFLCRVTNSAERIIYSCTFQHKPNIGWTDDLLNIIGQLIQKHGEGKIRIIGVAVPGTVTGNRIFNVPAIPEWEGVNLKSILAEHFDCKIYIENDIKSAAMCAYKSASHKTTHNMVYVSILSNFGSAIILDQTLYNSGKCFSGEIAYMAMDNRGQDEKKRGSADRQLAEILARDDKQGLVELTAKILVNITCIIDPDRIVVATPHLSQEAAVLIKEGMAQYIQSEYIPEVVIEEINAENNLSGIVSICNRRVGRAVQIVEN